jgi:hypothetical protein
MPHRVLFGEHRWRNLAYLLMVILIGYLALGGYALYLGRKLGSAEGRLDANATAEQLANAGQCYSRARSRPQTQSLLDLLALVADDIRTTTEDALKRNPDPELTELRKERLLRVKNFEEVLTLYRRSTEQTSTIAECDKEAMDSGLTAEQIAELRKAGDDQ